MLDAIIVGGDNLGESVKEFQPLHDLLLKLVLSVWNIVPQGNLPPNIDLHLNMKIFEALAVLVYSFMSNMEPDEAKVRSLVPPFSTTLLYRPDSSESSLSQLIYEC